MFGKLGENLQRMLWFGGARHLTTETYQRAILRHLSLHGPADLERIAEYSFPQVDTAVRENGIVEAAQILVNRGEITARRQGAKVDPVVVGISGLEVAFPPTTGE